WQIASFSLCELILLIYLRTYSHKLLQPNLYVSLYPLDGRSFHTYLPPDFYKEIIYFYTNQLNTDLVFFFIKLNIKTTNFYGIPQLNYPFLAIKKQASNSCPSLFGLLVQLQAAETRGQITSNHGSYKPNFLG